MTAGLADGVRIRFDLIGDIRAVLLDHDAHDAGAQRHDMERAVEVGARIENL